MFLGYQNNKIVLIGETYEELESNRFVRFDSIVETDVNYTLYDGEYLTPEEIEVKEKEAQKKELMAQLDALDLKCIRALRAIQSGSGTEADTAKLAELEAQAEDLRQQLKDLQGE